MTDTSDRIRGQHLEILSDGHYTLRKAGFEYRRNDGTWQHQMRESYDIGDGAAVLPIDRSKGLILLIRQFRWAAFAHGYRELLIEAIAGKLDGDPPDVCAIKEAREEAGVELSNLRQVFDTFMSPGAVQERLHLFVADYDAAKPRATQNGIHAEGEDIETLEVTLTDALAMVSAGEILDAKTIMLIQWAALALR
ncbi:MAG TPA: NUDIX domain-containing protein [Rhizomicrobium sp.]|jgi:nudix-type nucleoside diphosphatase (YffH/AdpP family)